jgi:hypothetical protein
MRFTPMGAAGVPRARGPPRRREALGAALLGDRVQALAQVVRVAG